MNKTPDPAVKTASSTASPAVSAPGSANTTVPQKMGTFYALGIPNFRLLWIGSLFSNFSQWIQQTTLSWLVYDMTGSGTLLGTVNGIRSFPTMILAPLSGVVADRFDRKALMLYAQLALLFMTFVMGLLLALGIAEVWHVMAFAVLSGVPAAVNQPVRAAITPMTVPRAALPNAAALNSGAFTFTRILGPGAAGIMIAAIGPAGNFFVQTIAYVLVMVTIYMMILPRGGQSKRGASVVFDLKEGFKYCYKNKAIRVLVLMGLFNPIFVLPFQALLVVFSKDIYHSGATGVGYLFAGSGTGAVIGALVIASANRIERRGLIQLLGIILFGISIVAFSFATSIWVAIAIIMFTGAFQLMVLSTNQALIQLSVPPKLMGRVNGIMAIEQGMTFVGAFFAGRMTDLVGPKETVLMLGITCAILGLLLMLFFPNIRNMGPATSLQAQKEAEASMGMAPS